MFLEIDGKRYDTSSYAKLAFHRYRFPERWGANVLEGKRPDDVHTWDTLFRAADGEFLLWRHERIAFGEEVINTDQVLVMTVEEVRQWNNEIQPPYVSQEFLELIGQA